MNIGKEGEVFLKDDKTGEYHKLGKTIDFEMQKEPVEQWKHGGHCEFCRRKSYCSKPCKAHKSRTQAVVSGMVAEAFLKAMIGK